MPNRETLNASYLGTQDSGPSGLPGNGASHVLGAVEPEAIRHQESMLTVFQKLVKIVEGPSNMLWA